MLWPSAGYSSGAVSSGSGGGSSGGGSSGGGSSRWVLAVRTPRRAFGLLRATAVVLSAAAAAAAVAAAAADGCLQLAPQHQEELY
jgi:hypothetical protein